MYVGSAPLEQSEWRLASGVHEGDRMPVIGGSGFRLASVRQSSQVRHDLKTARAMRERPRPPPRKAWAVRDLVAGVCSVGTATRSCLPGPPCTGDQSSKIFRMSRRDGSESAESVGRGRSRFDSSSGRLGSPRRAFSLATNQPVNSRRSSRTFLPYAELT
jgi:hypothetical protein